jgi:glutathione peroxidase
LLLLKKLPALLYITISAETKGDPLLGAAASSTHLPLGAISFLGVSSMRFTATLFAGIGVCALCVVSIRAEEKGDKTVPGVLNFKMKNLEGKEVELSKYKGKVLLIVNVASKCGYTPQYKALEALHEKYGDEGLVVLGVPSNDFGGQEPGTNEEIAKFCSTKYKVKFDMLAKVPVKGDKKCDLYKYLTSKDTDPKYAGEIEWNFTKFLIGRDGEIVGRFASAVKPESKEVSEAIAKQLKKK